MEWLELAARREQKEKARFRRQQRELRKIKLAREAYEKELLVLEARCQAMQLEEQLSRDLEAHYRAQKDERLRQQERDRERKLHEAINLVRRKAKKLGLPLETPGAAGPERLRVLEERIREQEVGLARASDARQRLEALPENRKRLRGMLQSFEAASLHQKVERAVYDLQCEHLVHLLSLDLVSNASTAHHKAVKHHQPSPELLNLESRNGLTPVLMAIFQKQRHVLRSLLESGASPDFETKTGMTPVLACVLTDDMVASSVLIEFNADLGHETKNHITPLLLAADKGRVALLKVLVRAGANVNHVNSTGRSPLIQAAISCQHETVNVLLAFGADKQLADDSKRTALDWTMRLEFSHIAALLKTTVPTASLLAQMQADEEQRADRDLLAHKLSIGAICRNERLQVMDSSLQSRDITKLLQLLSIPDVSYGPNYEDLNGHTPLLVCCAAGTSSDVIRCLELKCIPTHLNRHGVTALMTASIRGDLSIMRVLVHAGCHLLTSDFKGWDSFRYLNTHHHPDLVEKLTREHRTTEVDHAPPLIGLGHPLEATSCLQQYVGISHIYISTTIQKSQGKPSQQDSNLEVVDAEMVDSDSSNESDPAENCTTNSSSSEDEDPCFDPAIRRWSIRRTVLKHDSRRQAVFEEERGRILNAAKRGRRNGLIAPLPGDPAGRFKYPPCESCKQRRARKRCLNCEQQLCDVCHARLHEIAHRRHHQYEELHPELMVGKELKEAIVQNQENILQFTLNNCNDCITSMRDTLLGAPISLASLETDPEVERYERSKRLAREKEIMQATINIPVAAATYAQRIGDGAIFTSPPELDLVNLYIIQKKFGKAMELLLQAEVMVQSAMGFAHPLNLKIAIAKATIFKETREMDQCVRVLNDSLANFDARFTADHKDIMAGVALLLGALQQQARYDDAVRTCRHYLRIRNAVLGPSHALVQAMQARVDEFVALRESISMTHEDELVLQRLALDAERSELHRRDADSRVKQFRTLVLGDPTSCDAFMAFARKEFAEDLILFWADVERFKQADADDQRAARVLAVAIFRTYFKARRVGVITAVQRKKIKRAITTPGRNLPRSVFDEVHQVVQDVVYHGVYARFNVKHETVLFMGVPQRYDAIRGDGKETRPPRRPHARERLTQVQRKALGSSMPFWFLEQASSGLICVTRNIPSAWGYYCPHQIRQKAPSSSSSISAIAADGRASLGFYRSSDTDPTPKTTTMAAQFDAIELLLRYETPLIKDMERGDDVLEWVSAYVGSEQFQNAVDDFCEQHVDTFKILVTRGGPKADQLDAVEADWKTLHELFIDTANSYIEAFLVERGFTMEQYNTRCEEEIRLSEERQRHTRLSFFVQILMACCEYEQFLNLMKRTVDPEYYDKKELQYEAEAIIGSAEGKPDANNSAQVASAQAFLEYFETNSDLSLEELTQEFQKQLQLS